MPTPPPPCRPADVPLVASPRPAVIPAHGAVVMESRHAASFSGELCDDHAMFHLTMAGRAHWQHGATTTLITPGMLVFVPSGLAHRQRDLPGEPVTLYFIHVRPERLPSATCESLAQAGLLAIELQAQPGPALAQVRDLFQQMFYEQETRRPGWEAVVSARVLELAALTIRLAQRADAPPAAPILDGDGSDSTSRVAAYVARLDSEFFRSQSLEQAAQSVHLGRRRFTELFRTLTNETWNQRLLRLRLEHAERLLVRGELAVTAIAFACGFDDISHFNHSFKRRAGCAPLAWRARHRPIAQA